MANRTTTTYDPAQMITTFLGDLIDGYFDGTVIEIEHDEDAFSLKVGADGDRARAKNNNRAGKAKIVLMQSSPANDILSGYQIQDEESGTGIGPFMVNDVNGNARASCSDAFISKMGALKRGTEILAVEWTLILPKLKLFTGGAIQIP